jgi:undecaprenyl-diphosphatase
VENFIQLILLGIIEGITEFLPISSTAHLLIIQHWIGHRSEAFNIVIQSGAILAALLIYWPKFTSLITEFRKPETFHYILKLSAAFLLTCILGFAIKKLGWTLPRHPSSVNHLPHRRLLYHPLRRVSLCQDAKQNH